MLYEVRDADGALIMRAPLRTLFIIFRLGETAIARIEEETKELDATCALFFPRGGLWSNLRVQRLPLEIPEQSGRISIGVLALLIWLSFAAFAAWSLWESMQTQACLEKAFRDRSPVIVCWKGDK